MNNSEGNAIKSIFLFFQIIFVCGLLNPTYAQSAVFAVIGDFGAHNSHEADVANMISTWNPDYVLTVGDNIYNTSDYSLAVGQDYHQYMYPHDPVYGNSNDASTNLFWPAVGNHDWDVNNLSNYTSYFSSPITNRYYTKQIGDIEFFFVDSDTREPTGTASNSQQANWLHQQLNNSSANWKIVIFHHPAYCSGGSNGYMQWPFEDWGVDAVFSGHVHVYERILRDDNNDNKDLVYFVDGLGGASTGGFGSTVGGSIVRYNSDYGAMKVTESGSSLQFQFYAVSDGLIDTYNIDELFPVELTSFNLHLFGINSVKLVWETATEVDNYGFEIERKKMISNTIIAGNKENQKWLNVGFIKGAGNSSSPKNYSYIDQNLETGIYQYRLKQIDNDGKYKYSSTDSINISAPGAFMLYQNYPNPFNPSTTIKYSIPRNSFVTLKVYDILGREIATLVNMFQQAGDYHINFNASNLTSGIYFYKIQANGNLLIKKMMLLK